MTPPAPLAPARPWPRRHLLRRAAGLALGAAGLGLAPLAQAQGVELAVLKATRNDSGLSLDYSARLTLSASVEDALQRGVPMYFTAQATLLRYRWYWRDERVARVGRSWRVVFQPLTNSWRVSLGGLSQVYPSLADALGSLLRVRGWHVADADKLEPGERYQLLFVFRLDENQLPLPMQIDVGSDYQLGIERTLRID